MKIRRVFNSITAVLLSMMCSMMFLACASDNDKNGDNTPPLTPDMGVPETDLTKTIDQLTPAENLFAAVNAFAKQDYWTSVTSGSSVTSVIIKVNQQVAGTRRFNKGELFTESLSYSTFYKVAEQLYFSGDKALRKTATSLDKQLNAVWDDNITALTKEAFLADYGTYPSGLTKLYLNTQTVLSGELLQKEDGLYTFCYVLDPSGDKAPVFYRHEMQHMAGASSLPTFSSVKLTLTMDKDWTVFRLICNEEYTISKFGNNKCVGEITEEFTYYDTEVDTYRFIFASYL